MSMIPRRKEGRISRKATRFGSRGLTEEDLFNSRPDSVLDIFHQIFLRQQAMSVYDSKRSLVLFHQLPEILSLEFGNQRYGPEIRPTALPVWKKI
ncbi:hypothetical protein I7I48_00332 [Histoplasma ohiense]|nr:hypothetical protein I7I48_00332 [Histoplasma ohiense (nom. inval.)]